jgi:hypothetical protein
MGSLTDLGKDPSQHKNGSDESPFFSSPLDDDAKRCGLAKALKMRHSSTPRHPQLK